MNARILTTKSNWKERKEHKLFDRSNNVKFSLINIWLYTRFFDTKARFLIKKFDNDMLFKEFDNWLSRGIDKFGYIRSSRDLIIDFRRYRLRGFGSLSFKDDDVIIWWDFIMSFKLNALKTNVIKTFIIAVFVSFAALNENRLLLKVNKMFTRLFLIKGFFEFGFLCEIMTITI